MDCIHSGNGRSCLSTTSFVALGFLVCLSSLSYPFAQTCKISYLLFPHCSSYHQYHVSVKFSKPTFFILFQKLQCRFTSQHTCVNVYNIIFPFIAHTFTHSKYKQSCVLFYILKKHINFWKIDRGLKEYPSTFSNFYWNSKFVCKNNAGE